MPSPRIPTLRKIAFFLAVSTFFLLSQLPAQPFHYPKTLKTNHIDSYFGTDVSDPYRWLEDDTSAAVAEWVKAQNEVTFGYLEKIPYRSKIRERLEAIWNYPRYSSPFHEGEYYYYYKNDGLQNQSVLYRQKSLTAEGEVFIDPNTFSEDGTVSLRNVSFSKSGDRLAYGVSSAGSDWMDIVVMDAESKLQSDTLHWIKFSGISWYGDGFFYSRYDAPSDPSKKLSNKNEYHKAYYHRIGTPQSDDSLVYQDPGKPEAIFSVRVSEDEHFATLSVTERGAKGNALYYTDLTGGNDLFLPVITTNEDDIYMIDAVGDKLLLFTNRNAPNGKIIRFDPSDPGEKAWETVVPEKKEVLTSVSSAGGRLFLKYIQDVTHHVYVHGFDGKLEREVVMPSPGTVGGFGGHAADTTLFFTLTSFTFPSTIYRYDVSTGNFTLYRKSEIDFNADDYMTTQVFYPSRDGTRIPMFIVHRKGLPMDGTNPALLYGYGGFNISLMPSFSITRLLFLEQGGVLAVANLRGGGEYGEEWHEEGMKLNKKNVFDDCIAAAEYLIREKYTSPEKLALEGRSNGGLLVGAVINRRPDLFKVALPGVGVMDMLRFHKFTIGWAWVADYGSSDDPEQFPYLLSYSPLHNIREGVEYPATLVTTADHDDRVVPAHSFKYIATLQEKYHGENPVMIRIETRAGHGGGKPTSKIIEEYADIYAFMFYNLGVEPSYP